MTTEPIIISYYEFNQLRFRDGVYIILDNYSPKSLNKYQEIRYYKKDHLHRLDGPAVETRNNFTKVSYGCESSSVDVNMFSYYIEGQQYTKEDFYIKTNGLEVYQ